MATTHVTLCAASGGQPTQNRAWSQSLTSATASALAITAADKALARDVFYVTTTVAALIEVGPAPVAGVTAQYMAMPGQPLLIQGNVGDKIAFTAAP